MGSGKGKSRRTAARAQPTGPPVYPQDQGWAGPWVDFLTTQGLLETSISDYYNVQRGSFALGRAGSRAFQEKLAQEIFDDLVATHALDFGEYNPPPGKKLEEITFIVEEILREDSAECDGLYAEARKASTGNTRVHLFNYSGSYLKETATLGGSEMKDIISNMHNAVAALIWLG